MTVLHETSTFIEEITPRLREREYAAQVAQWILATQGGEEAKKRFEEAELACRMLKSDRELFQRIKKLRESDGGQDVLRSRSIQLLYNQFLKNQIPENLIRAIIEKEAEVGKLFTEFRADLNGQRLSDNDIGTMLKQEKNPQVRKEIWAASKQVGQAAGPMILELVRLRNIAAQALGYSNYYGMRLALDEIDEKWLHRFFKTALQQSAMSYRVARLHIDQVLSRNFGVPATELGPWAWGVFTQEDPIAPSDLDRLFANQDIVMYVRNYYHSVGFGNEFDDVFSRSDLYAREGKNQHGFCIDVDRMGDVRVLMNVLANEIWFRIFFHEFGHAVDAKSRSSTLPWILRSFSHMMTTEAIAVFFESPLYSKDYLRRTLKSANDEELIFNELISSRARYKLIFPRWVVLMTNFESELYKNPDQDLNALWWGLTKSIHGIPEPKRPPGAMDWASKYHIALAPVYYHNYLLADIVSEQLKATVARSLKYGIEDPFLAEFLRGRWFRLGASLRWDQLIRFATGEQLNLKHWTNALKQL